MARAPVTERGRQTRERLIAGAAELIREQGVEKTSIGQVLALTSTSKSQIYHYFADKDALVREVIAHETEAVLEQSASAMNGVTSWTTLRGWLDTIVAAQEADACRHGCPVGSLASELADRSDRARQSLATSFAQWEIAIGAILERLKACGRLRPRTDTQALATATLAAIQGGLLLSKTFRDPAPLRTALDAIYIYLRSFAPEAD
jgi:TetR/AcrR family transcriptional regulator, transcriptional repressor for nem operon